MKKYVAVWVAMFFFVICVSLYLMLETLNSAPGRFPDMDGESLSSFERKINEIQKDIEKNHDTIRDIKDAVRKFSSGDKESVEKLKILETQHESLKKDAQHIENMKHQDPAGDVINMQQGDDAKSRNVGYGVMSKEVAVSDEMCTWADAPKSSADVQMTQVFDMLPFDNQDGGSWKQGWDVKYPDNRWNADKKLKVFVVPHSHNDPGWLKTFDAYYSSQTKHIFENMVQKLEQYPRMRFIYAEMSFLSLWWGEIDVAMKARVKKLLDNNQLEIVTGGWVMTDEANSHYFAMLDQLIEGHQWLHGTLGVKPQSGWAIDPFGHTPTMAYLLRRSGFNNMLIQRVHYAVKKHLAKEKQLEFMWRQQWDREGSTDVLCHMMPFYSYDVPHTCGPDPKVCCQFDFRRLPGGSYTCPWKVPPSVVTDNNVEERTKTLIDQYKKKATLYRSNTLFVPLGDDFRYDKTDEWDKQHDNYIKIFDYLHQHPELGVEAQFGTLSDYFTALYKEYSVEPGTKPGDFPVLSGDFFTYSDRDDHYWSGYYTSRPFYKNLDRLMESHLRAAEILFSFVVAAQHQSGGDNFNMADAMNKLVMARRNLGLFQHHDGITGTAKDFVVVDYGNRLMSALMDMKKLMSAAATYLTLDDKSLYADSVPLFNVDEDRQSHDSLPEKTVIALGVVGDDAKPVMFYNPLGQSRAQVVKIYVDTPSVEVRDQQGTIIESQVEPYWTRDEISTSKYKVSLRVTVPALGIVRYTVKHVATDSNHLNVPVSVLIFNSGTNSQIKSPPFSVEKAAASDFSLENAHIKATFAGSTGLLKSVTTKPDNCQHKTNLEFVQYGTVAGRDKSGAYLFLPNGKAKPMSMGSPTVRIMQGPIVSEVHVFFDLVEHVVRLYNSSGIDGLSLDMFNIVDISSEKNYELAVRITTDVDNKQEFYTDLNGFQMQKHKTYSKLPLQANVYPMPTQAFIEDFHYRFSILSAQSLGFSNLEPGVMEVMLDRRLNQDDFRGLTQGVLDNKRTPSRFKLLIEKPKEEITTTDKPMAFPSLMGHHTSLQLIHPVIVIPQNNAATKIPKQSDFTPMKADLPCDTHLVNLRTMQNSDDGPERLVPRNEAGLLLHRLGTDCDYPNRGLLCKHANGQVSLSGLFSEVEIASAKSTSLTLIHEEEEVETTANLNLEPMEISAFKVTLN